jgi:hypothetical protein
MHLNPWANHKLIKLFLISVFKIDEWVQEVLWGTVNWILFAEFVEQIYVEFIVVLCHEALFGYVFELTSNLADLINWCTFIGHLREVN